MSVRVLEGDCREVLATLPDESVQMVCTSPPYFGLRDYGVDGQLGLERTPADYVANMVAVFREVRRVLRDDGTLWLNLGDSYAQAGGNTAGERKTARVGNTQAGVWRAGSQAPPPGLKPKDLIGIPWRVAFALQADGWYLRSDIIWAKPNPMPESVTDRPTKAHEYLFLLSKSERYFYDAEAIAEPVAEVTLLDPRGNDNGQRRDRGYPGTASNGGTRLGSLPTRNARSVWTVATQPYGGSHFATMPPELAKRCILAGSSPRACEHCGAPWARVVEKEGNGSRGASPAPGSVKAIAIDNGTGRAGRADADRRGPGTSMSNNPAQRVGGSVTTGWEPTCNCPNNTGTARSVVLDPFGGAGTTGLVADRLGRDAVLIELNPEYASMARKRISGDNPLFTEVA